MKFKVTISFACGIGLLIALVVTAQGSRGADVNKALTENSDLYLPVVNNNYETMSLFFDYFSFSCSGWYIGDEDVYRWSYLSGDYELLVRQAGWISGSLAPIVGPTNYSVEADMRNTGGAGQYGLIFGFINWNNYYVFLVDPAFQMYSVWRYDTDWIKVIAWTNSLLINPASATNHLKVKRDGIQISVYVNGQLLATANDGTLTGNRVGLCGQLGSSAPEAMLFDNFEIRLHDISVCPNSTSLLSKTPGAENSNAISILETQGKAVSIPNR